MEVDKEIKCQLDLPMLKEEKFVIFLKLNDFMQLNNVRFA